MRLHTRQCLALYDQFGRLIFGSEEAFRDCLEFVVFERHLTDEYGKWRVHGRIKPEELDSGETVLRTVKIDYPQQEENEFEGFQQNREESLSDWHERRSLYMKKWWAKQAIRTRTVRKYKFK